ncbi:MAG TPA: phosphoribosyltransferase family protein [Polyangiales bacterium]
MRQTAGLLDSRDLELRTAAGVHLSGDLTVPRDAKALVVFAHGSGSNRYSPRNRFVARRLEAHGYGTLLLDLEPNGEQQPLEELAERLAEATRSMRRDPQLDVLPIVYFGASTGAAVALLAAARRPEGLVTVISRGGRPDLVPSPVLEELELPLLFLVGSLDEEVLALNRAASHSLHCDYELDVIAGASHLFEEPGTLERVAEKTIEFLGRFVPAPPARASQATSTPRFNDRRDAGQQLARALERYRGTATLVLGVPRGGVPVAYEVARHLDLPLDVVVGRKLGAPGREELALGAITADGTTYLNERLIKALSVSPQYVERVSREQAAEALRREQIFRAGRSPLQLQGRSVLVIDDGLATSATLRAAIRALRAAKVGHLAVAVPVGAPASCHELAAEVDELVCLHQPTDFHAVGAHYASFDQTTDEEVQDLLHRASP